MKKPCILLLLFIGELLYTALIVAGSILVNQFAMSGLLFFLIWCALWIPLMLLAAMPIMAVKRVLVERFDVEPWQFVLLGPTPSLIASAVLICVFAKTVDETQFAALRVCIVTATFFMIKGVMPKRRGSRFTN